MAMKLSLVDILRYSPYDHNYDLRTVGYDERFFIDNFLVIPKSFEEELEEFRIALKRSTTDHKSYIILSGYSGCGKTTLLHYLSHTLNKEEGHLFSIVNLTKEAGYGNQGLDLLRTALEDEVQSILENSIDTLKIVYANYARIRNFRPKEDPRKEELRADLSIIISKSVFAEHEKQREDFLNEIRDFVGKITVTELLVYYMLDKIIKFEKYLKQKHTIINIEKDTTESLVICFDNMDELTLQSLTVDFWESYNAARTAIDNISARASLFMKGACDRFLTIILTLRESNIALYSSQWDDRFDPKFLKRRLILDGDVAEIMEKRTNFIKENEHYFKADTSWQLRALIDIFNTDKDWVRSQVLPLFNFDYRKYFEFLPNLLKRDTGVKGIINYDLTFDQYISIDTTNKTISRGVMYAYLIEFAFRTYFDRFIAKPEESCNKYRMLLTIMYNLAYPTGLPDNVRERNRKRPKRFTLKTLLETVNIFTEDEILKMAVEFFPLEESSFAQWIMIYNSNLFKLANANLRYDEIKRKKPQNLTPDEQDFLRLIENSYVHFNASAFAYLRYIITHYEYYTYLVRRTNVKLRVAPLALLTKVIYIDISTENRNVPCFEFEHCINLVFNYVTKKKEAIEKYYTENFLASYPSETEYSKSYNAFGENDQKKSFYITKLLFTHINYLDNFRYFIWYNNAFNNLLNNERVRPVENSKQVAIIPVKTKDQIQDFLISTIERYVETCRRIKYMDTRNNQTLSSMEKRIIEIRNLKDIKTGVYHYPPDTGSNINDKWIWIRGDRSVHD